MATFYLLPAPGFLCEVFERQLQALFPGLRWDAGALAQVVAEVSQAAASHSDVYLIQQHDLPVNANVLQTLADAFGAEPGDTVIEMHAGPRLGEWRIRRRVVNQAA
jgi:hypothetical protein